MNLTWIIKKQPSLSIFTAWNQPFTSDNTSYNGIAIIQFSGETMPTILYLTNSQYTGITAYKNGGWIKEAYRTITFTADPTNVNLINWLSINAERLKTAYEYIRVKDHKVQVDSAIRDGNGKVISESYMTNIAALYISNDNATAYLGTKGKSYTELLNEQLIKDIPTYTALIYDFSTLQTCGIIKQLVEGNYYLITADAANGPSRLAFLGKYTHDITTNYSNIGTNTAVFEGNTVISSTYNYNRLENTPFIPTVPTKVSAFTNDAGYITNNDMQNKEQYQYNHIIKSLNSVTNPVNNGNYVILDSLAYTTPTITSTGFQSWGDGSTPIAGNSKIYVRTTGWANTLQYSTTDPTSDYTSCNISYSGYTPSSVSWKQVVYNNGIFFAIDGNTTTAPSWYATSIDGINFSAYQLVSSVPITNIRCISNNIVFTTNTYYTKSGTKYYKAFSLDTATGTFESNEYTNFGEDLAGDPNFPTIFDFNIVNNRLILLTTGNSSKDEGIVRLLVSPLMETAFSVYEFNSTAFNNTARNIYYTLAKKSDSIAYILNDKDRCNIFVTDTTNNLNCLSTDGITFDSTTTWTVDQVLPDTILIGLYYTSGTCLFVTYTNTYGLAITYTTDISLSTAYVTLATYSDRYYNNSSLSWINSGLQITDGKLILVTYNSAKTANYLITIPVEAIKSTSYVYSKNMFIPVMPALISYASSADIDALFSII